MRPHHTALMIWIYSLSTRMLKNAEYSLSPNFRRKKDTSLELPQSRKIAQIDACSWNDIRSALPLTRATCIAP